MGPQELHDFVRHRPFEPFRIVMTDGAGFDIRHPDLLMVGERSAVVGVPRSPQDALYERTIKVDLRHVIRIEPLPLGSPPATGAN